MSLGDRLRAQIALEGPMTVADYMTACLHDSSGGYYATRPALGAEGDFITAPLVSQMFGELIGLWVAQVWRDMGQPPLFRLVELGPGDATLMSDALRALRRAPQCLAAADLWLVEPSRPLQARQAAVLEPAEPTVAPRWATRLAQVPSGVPMILIANEVLDCFPARQFLKTPSGWAERRIGLDRDGALSFGLAPAPNGLSPPGDAPDGAIWEWSPAQAALGAELGQRVCDDGGAALLIDYGRDRLGFGDTFQAVKQHHPVPVLEAPGEADVTIHADFPIVAGAACGTGAATTRIIGPGAFLRALGIELRAAALARARPDRTEVIGRQLDRLIGPEQMGVLFKVLAIHQKGLNVPGFDGV